MKQIKYNGQIYNSVEGMSKGLIVLDENVENLEEALQDKNIRVLVVPKGTPDLEIMKKIIPFRMFVTINAKDFENQVTDYEFGLIALDQALLAQGEEAVADKISKAASKYSLWSLKINFIVRIHASGKTTFKKLNPTD